MRNRDKLIELLTRVDDEAFYWLVTALETPGRPVWPDELGGFKDNLTMQEIRKESHRYLGEM